MNNRTNVVLGAVAALFAITIVFRFVVLSQLGVSGSWIFYLGLPFGGIVGVVLLLLRLGLLNFGESSGTMVQPWQHNTAATWPAPVPAPPAATWPAPVPAPPAATAQRLQELETLRSSGSISDTEYAAKRARIISGI